MRRFLKWTGIVLVSLFIVLWMTVGVVGTRLVTAPRHGQIKPKTEIAGRPVEQISLTTEDGVVLSAWYVPNNSENAVVTLSGIGANRGQLVSTAETYINWGFSALLPDLRGTGESGGDQVSIGYHERKDLIACVQWLKGKGLKNIGAHGFSLGAATVCFAMNDLTDLGFAVVESSYDTMQHATDNRLDLYSVPHFIGWPYRLLLSHTLGADFTTLSPLTYMPKCTCPTLVMSGDSEGVLSAGETTALYEACGAKHKRLHLYKGGHHRPSIGAFPEESKETLHQFLTEEAGCALP